MYDLIILNFLGVPNPLENLKEVLDPLYRKTPKPFN